MRNRGARSHLPRYSGCRTLPRMERPPHPHFPEPVPKPLHVMLVLNSYEPDGPNTLFLRVCQRLCDRENLHLETVALSRGGDLERNFLDMGVGTQVVHSRGPKGWLRLWDWAKEIGERRHRPRIVHTSLLWPDLTIRILRARLGWPIVASTNHGLHALADKGAFLGNGYRALERLSRHRCHAFVAVSDALREEMLAAGYRPDRVRTIHNGVDAVQVFPTSQGTRARIRLLLDLPEDVPMLCTAGRLVELKGVRDSLAALPIVHAKHPKAVLVFVGDGPLRGALEAEAERLGVGDRVRFIGRLSCRLPEVLSAADVVLQPSHREAFGIVAAEAMATTVPVVATRVGGLAEMIRDGETGVLVPPHRPDALAAATLRILADRDAAREMGERAREYVIASFEIGRTAEAYADFWQSLDAEMPPPGAEAHGMEVDSQPESESA